MVERIKNIVKIAIIPFIYFINLCIFFIIGYPIPCILYITSGLQCPGCGLTRSVESILHGDVIEALRYNYLMPLYMLASVVMLIEILKYVKNGNTNKWHGKALLSLACIMVIFSIARNII